MKTKTFDFTFSAENLKDIPFDMYENNFTFIVNDKVYQTNRFVADLLSPYIRKMHYTDKAINNFIISTKNIKCQTNNNSSKNNDYFSDFLNFVQIEDDQNSERQIFYSEYFHQLCNQNEYIHLQHQFLENLTEENAIDRLISFTKFDPNFYDDQKFEIFGQIDKIINFVSSHFESIDKDKISQLNIYVIERILNNKNLKLDEEETLLNFLLNLYEKDHSNSPLFEYINFENISKESFEIFIHAFEIQDINQSIWESICDRFIPFKIHKNPRKSTQKVKKFECQKGNEFNGIMKYLTNKTNGNIHDNGTIEITSNSIRSDSDHPKNLVDFSKNNFYHSGNDGKAFVCFDFKDKQVQISSYSIKSNRNDGPHSFNLRNWVMEVSEDNKNWIEIDRHEDDYVLNGRNIIFTFDVKVKENSFYRFVRLRQTGDSWSLPVNPNYFWFYFIEFFGKIKENK